MLTNDRLADVLTHYPVLAAIPSDAHAELAARAEPFSAPAGKGLFEPGAACSGMLLLTQGAVRVVAPALGRRATVVFRVRPGETCVLSAVCLLGGTSYPAGAVSESAVAGALLPADLFNSLIGRSGEFRQFVFAGISLRLAEILQRIDEIAGRSLEERLAALLLAEPQPVGRTHRELADELGTAREVVSRLLGSFAERKLVRLGRREIWVLKPEALRAPGLAS